MNGSGSEKSETFSGTLIEISTLPTFTGLTLNAGRKDLDKLPCLMLSVRMSTSGQKHRWRHFRTRTVT